MEKLDAIIAAAGAILLAIAVAGAALTATPEASYSATPRVQDLLLDDGNAGHPAEGGYTDTFPFEVDDAGITDIFVNTTVTYLPQGPVGGAAMHAVLRAPNGTSYELDGTAAGTPTQPAFSVAFVIPLASPPAARTVQAASVDEARAALAAPVAPGAVGEWRLEVSFSPGLQPASSSTVAWEATAQRWTWDVVPAVPAGR